MKIRQAAQFGRQRPGESWVAREFEGLKTGEVGQFSRDGADEIIFKHVDGDDLAVAVEGEAVPGVEGVGGAREYPMTRRIASLPCCSF